MWGCSNFVEKTFRDDGLCQYAEPISELYFGGLGDADRHTACNVGGVLIFFATLALSVQGRGTITCPT
jgi:hypothetical protein